jgi:hypothetical protein
LATEFGTAIKLGSILGIFISIFLAPIHLALQIAGNFAINKLKPAASEQKRTMILNFPAMLVLVFVFVSAAMPMSQEAKQVMLRQFFSHPMPPSVNVKAVRMARGLNEGSFEILFSISKPDFEKVLKDEGYSLMSSNLTEVDLADWQRAAQKTRSHTSPFLCAGKCL